MDRCIESRYAPKWTLIRDILTVLAPVSRALTSPLDNAIKAQLWDRGFDEMARYQRLFRSKIFGGATLRVIGQISSLQHLRGLFNGYRGWPPVAFDSSWKYRCVVTGEHREEDFQTLLSRSIERTVAWWKETTVERDRWVPHGVGPSLNTGIVGTKRSDLKWWSTTSS